MLEQLRPQTKWLIIEGESYKVINENEVDYILKNDCIIKASLNLYTYDREVSVFDNNKRQIAFYKDLSKDRIVEKIRMYESFPKAI